MRDVLIAVTTLSAAAYGAWSYVPASADMQQAGSVEDAVMPDVAQPVTIASAAADALPVPRARPGQELVATLAFDAPARSGSVEVLHAGLIEIDGQRFALFGVDAPSVNQTCRNQASGLWACGTDARKAVAKFVADRNVVCEAVVEGDDETPILSRCEADGVDLNTWVVSNGWAVADAGVDEAYVGVQQTARIEKKGLWAGWFETPSEWRNRNDVIVEDTIQVASRGDRV